MRYVTIQPVKWKGKRIEPGKPVEMAKELGDSLVASGVLGPDPDAAAAAEKAAAEQAAAEKAAAEQAAAEKAAAEQAAAEKAAADKFATGKGSKA